jgi:SAM-dependent methyltransferase
MTTADWLRAKIGPAPDIEPVGAISERAPSVGQGSSDEFAFFTQHLRPDMRVLHAYFGAGRVSQLIAPHLPMGDLVGIDPELSNVRALRARSVIPGSADISFQRSSMEDLPFANGEFDALLLDGSLATGTSPERALEEAIRVLVPGGLLGARHTVASSRVFTGTSPQIEQALRRKETVLRDLGGDPDFGLRQPQQVRAAGFVNVRVSSSTEQRTDDELLMELSKGGFMSMNEEDPAMDQEEEAVVISFVTVVQSVAWKPA